jgi:hypothetical protein
MGVNVASQDRCLAEVRILILGLLISKNRGLIIRAYIFQLLKMLFSDCINHRSIY